MMTNILEYLDRTAKLYPEKTALADDKNSLSLTNGRNNLKASVQQ